MKIIFILILSLVAFQVGAENEMTPNELEKWFESDEIFHPDQINEGELEFLSEPPQKPPLHSLNLLTIGQESIKNGWVSLEQCYKQLDPVPDTEIVYRYKSMRELKVISKRNIETAQVKGQSVQITNITRGAELCITAEVRIFYKNPDGTFSLVNGPFHRKFLDGYFPYHLTLKIIYPATQLKIIQTKPKSQAGFLVKKSNGVLFVDSYFEGMLNTEIIFQLQ